jgi:Tetracyclin repressor-like, C-terminal domain
MVSKGPIGGDWRAALRSMAHRTREAVAKHAWFVDLLSGRPHVGPNALAHLEASFAALSDTPGFESIDAVVQAVGTVNAYVIGAIRNEASELRAEAESGMTESEWHAASWPYLQRMIATGRFPTVARVVHDATHPPADVVFDRGLECVLDGIAARRPR